MARIVCISKYPPIEGGIASKTFWLARSLVERGHEIHIVTDRIGIAPEYSLQTYEDITDTKNLCVHRASTELPWHIPNNHHCDIDLLNTAVQVIKETNAEIIDAGYLIPYGIVAYLASQISGVPFILRHGGSDIHKFLRKGAFSGLLKPTFHKASVVITDKTNYSTICQLSNKAVITPPYVPNPAFFRPIEMPPQEKPTLALIGKANYRWRDKGWHRAVGIMERLQDKFRLLIASQGVGFNDFRRHVEERIKDDSIIWRGFVHPMEMPELLSAVSGVFALFEDLPFPAFSNLLVEALYSGKTIIVDRPDVIQFHEDEATIVRALSSKAIQIPAREFEQSANTISEYFSRYAKMKEAEVDYNRNHRSYIELNEKTMLSVMQK